jgi:hypothetical protein
MSLFIGARQKRVRSLVSLYITTEDISNTSLGQDHLGRGGAALQFPS